MVNARIIEVLNDLFEDAMLAQLHTTLPLPKVFSATHLLILLPKNKALPKDYPHAPLLATVLKRRDMKVDEFAKSAVSAVTESGSLVVWAMVDFEKEAFAQQVQVRKALQLLFEEQPKQIAIAVLGDEAQRKRTAELAIYAAWVNSALLPMQKKKDERKPLKKIELFGYDGKFDEIKAQAEGNLLCRELTVLPPNNLTPAVYRERISKLAKEQGWKHEEFDMKKLRKMGAGAFVAVAQGSADDDAAIVHLCYKHPKAKKTIALVGKGICFDTGGHNLKPARYMNNMHEDMNGSAVALGILLAATQSKLPVNIDCWLALAQNQCGRAHGAIRYVDAGFANQA